MVVKYENQKVCIVLCHLLVFRNTVDSRYNDTSQEQPQLVVLAYRHSNEFSSRGKIFLVIQGKLGVNRL